MAGSIYYILVKLAKFLPRPRQQKACCEVRWPNDSSLIFYKRRRGDSLPVRCLLRIQIYPLKCSEREDHLSHNLRRHAFYVPSSSADQYFLAWCSSRFHPVLIAIQLNLDIWIWLLTFILLQCWFRRYKASSVQVLFCAWFSVVWFQEVMHDVIVNIIQGRKCSKSAIWLVSAVHGAFVLDESTFTSPPMFTNFDRVKNPIAHIASQYKYSALAISISTGRN